MVAEVYNGKVLVAFSEGCKMKKDDTLENGS